MNPRRRMRRAAQRRGLELPEAGPVAAQDDELLREIRAELQRLRPPGASKLRTHSFALAREASLRLACPTCDAKVGEGCVGKSGKALYDLHAARRRAAGY